MTCIPFKAEKGTTDYVNNVRREMSPCSEQHDKCPKCKAIICGRHWWVGAEGPGQPEKKWCPGCLPKHRRLEIAAGAVLEGRTTVDDEVEFLRNYYFPDTTAKEIEDMMNVLTTPK